MCPQQATIKLTHYPRHKGEITSAMNERDNPYVLEMPVPRGGLGMALKQQRTRLA
jgi:hypothetical protein